MQVISAALAFAIVMLVLSMVVSTIVETIHRVLGMRENGLYVMLGRLYDDVLKRYFEDETRPSVPPPAPPPPLTKQQFQAEMSENRAPVPTIAPEGPAETVPSLSGLLSRGTGGRGRGLSFLTTAGFMERLGSSAMGAAILKQVKSRSVPSCVAEKPTDAVLQDIAQKFEAFSNEASVFFERRARTLSIVVAMVLAFAVYVDPIEIFSTFVRNPALAESVISHSDETSKAFEAGNAAREKQVSQPPVAPSGESLQAFQQAAKELDTLKKEYADALTAVRKSVDELSGLGVPVGWNDQRKRAAGLIEEEAVCRAADKQPRVVAKKQDCQPGETPGVRIVRHALPNWSTILSLLFGGLLVGLGGPFWFDMIKSLTSIRDLFRGPQGAPAGATAPVAAALPQETPQPRTPVDIFRAAYAGQAGAGQAGRAP